jgi:tripartite-type tricarboxylate transporter receptor subunit TctC
VKFTHVPYRGGGPAVVDVMAGHVDALLVTLPAAIEHIRAGRLPALAVSSAARSSALPDLPTIAEAAGLPGYEVVTWQGILAPAGTPAPVVGRLNAALLRALARPEAADGLRRQGFEVTGSTPEAFATLVRHEAERWPPIVRASGALLD